MNATVQRLLFANWTIVSERRTDDGEYIVVRIQELPGFVVAGSAEEVDADFWDALEACLDVAIEHGDSIVRPPQKFSSPYRRVESIDTRLFATAFMPIPLPVPM